MKNCAATKKLANVHSDIRGELYEEAMRMKRSGKNILRLNTGNPGVFGFNMPESVGEAIKKYAFDSVSYCDYKGTQEARDSVLAYHRGLKAKNISQDDIYITNGVSEAASILTTAFIDKCDEILVPSPCYSLWSNSIKIAGGIPIYYKCDEENGWNPDIIDIESKITDKTTAILVINPNNPTGAVYKKEILQKIADIAREKELLIFSDEIYDRLTYDNAQMISLSSLCDEDTICVTLNGLSKSHCICGIRSGWMVISGKGKRKDILKKEIDKLTSMRLCANALMNMIIPAALNDTYYTKKLVTKGGRLYEQRKAVFNQLDKSQALSYVKNDGAFYIFPKINSLEGKNLDDKKFCFDLLQAKNILIMPGSCFEYEKKDRIRLVMLPDKDIMVNAIKDIEDFASQYKT